MACLQCSFSDKKPGEYVQFKKRNSPSLAKKLTVGKVGRQADGTWVLSSNAHLSSSGALIPIEGSLYVWIGDVFTGHGVARDTDQCSIELPLTTDPLCTHGMPEGSLWAHFYAMCLDNGSDQSRPSLSIDAEEVEVLPGTPAYGQSGTGKTTALLCGLSLYGACSTHFYSKITKEKVLQLWSSSGVPLRIDDPESRNVISRLIIDLYNGAMNTRGSRKPSSTCIISSNFTTMEQQRCV